MKALVGEYKKKITNLENLLNGERLGCPICKHSKNVIITGNGRNGTKKFLCKEEHDLQITGRDKDDFRFSTYTSLEAYKVYQDFLVEALTLLTTCEGTYEGIIKYLNIIEHMVGLSIQALIDYIGENGKNSIKVDGDLVVIYAVFSGIWYLTKVNQAKMRSV